MNKRMRRTVRLLASPLALLWLVLSNAALCLAMPMPVAGPVQADVHADAHGGAHAGHHGPAQHDVSPHGHAAHAQATDAQPDCCGETASYPCCSGSSYAPAFDAPVLAKLVAAALPAEHPALLLVAATRPPVRQSRPLPPAQAGPPVYLRCCSFLI